MKNANSSNEWVSFRRSKNQMDSQFLFLVSTKVAKLAKLSRRRRWTKCRRRTCLSWTCGWNVYQSRHWMAKIIGQDLREWCRNRTQATTTSTSATATALNFVTRNTQPDSGLAVWPAEGSSSHSGLSFRTRTEETLLRKGSLAAFFPEITKLFVRSSAAAILLLFLTALFTIVAAAALSCIERHDFGNFWRFSGN